jgi:hypothetical protein
MEEDHLQPAAAGIRESRIGLQGRRGIQLVSLQPLVSWFKRILRRDRFAV